MSRKAGNLRMETGCLHRKVGTRHQTQDVKSPLEYGWHSTAIRCHDQYDLTNTPFDSCRRKEWLKRFFPPGFSRKPERQAARLFRGHLTEPLRVSSI